jgi:hypothetical protein
MHACMSRINIADSDDSRTPTKGSRSEYRRFLPQEPDRMVWNNPCTFYEEQFLELGLVTFVALDRLPQCLDAVAIVLRSLD